MVTRSVHPSRGRCRKGTGRRVVRGLQVVERIGESQRPGRDAIHAEHEHDIELNRSQGWIAHLEIPMRKRPERKERGRPRERLRSGERRGDVIAALRRTRRRAPPDNRGRYAVRDDGITRLASGEVVRRVMPDSVDGDVSDLRGRRAPGCNKSEEQQKQLRENGFRAHCSRSDCLPHAHKLPRSTDVRSHRLGPRQPD